MSEIFSASSNSGTTNSHIFFKAFKFTMISYVVSVILISVLAFIIVNTNVPQSISNPSVKGITLFGACLSALLTAKSCRTKGWLCGFFTGAFNVALLMFVGTLLVDAEFFSKSSIFLVFYAKKLIAPAIPKEMMLIITPAVSTPRTMKRKAFQNFIFISAAIREPVQAPVPGIGIATKRKSPT